MAAFGEELLLGLRIEAVIDHAGEIAESGSEAGFGVPPPEAMDCCGDLQLSRKQVSSRRSGDYPANR